MSIDTLTLPLPVSDLRALLHKYGVTSASLFGSYARGEAQEDSDLDLLVTLAPDRTYLDLGGLYEDLRQNYGVRADLATRLNRHFEPSITPDLVEVL